MTPIRVALVGATGATGQSIVNGLLNSPDTSFEITALTRPESISKPINTDLQKRGVRVLPVDLKTTPQDTLVQLLSGIDVVISAIFFASLDDEIPLANAAKEAGVKRFVQSAFMVVLPPRGVVDFREKKELNLQHIQKLRLPYTYIDAGWWYQLTLPRLPSGKIDYALPSATKASQPGPVSVGLDGTVPSALADLRDVGRYVARIIVDARTLNKKVHVFNEAWTQNEVLGIVEEMSGETLERDYVSEADACAKIQNARDALAQKPTDMSVVGSLVASQLFYSWGVRGDNTPEYADYLGYLSGKDLYPDFKFTSLREYVAEVLEGKAVGVYQG